MDKIKKAVLVLDPDKLSKMNLGERQYAADSFVIYYDNKEVEIKDDFNQLSENLRREEIDTILAAIKKDIGGTNKYFAVKKGSDAYNTVMKDVQNKMNGSSGIGKKVAIGAGAVAVTALGLAACSQLNKDDEDKVLTNNDNTNVESEMNAIVTTPSMDGKDFAFYTENAINTNQKQLMLDVNHFLTQLNGQEDWMKTTLTEEQMKQYDLKDADCLYGLTANDAYSLTLRFGHYSNADYVTLTGGNDIDVVSIMDDSNSQSNGALSSIISYYVCSDECNLKIDDLINFNEKETAKIEEIESLLKEYKTLDNHEKTEKEAEEKMQEIKAWFNEFAYSTDSELDNVKSYILRTFLPACSIISEMHQYKDTIELNLYDTKKETNVIKEVKTALFDEIMMRNLVFGYDEPGTMGAFDAEVFLDEHKIDEKRYNLLNTDIATSKADESCSSQSERLQQANEYMYRLRSENYTAEAAFYTANQAITVDPTKENPGEQVAVQMDALNNIETEYDKLVHGTYNSDLVLEMLNNSLIENNLYPKNVNYFRTAKITEMQKAYEDTHGVTQGKKGDTIKTETQKNVEVGNVTVDPSVTDHVILDGNGNKTTEEKIKEEARNENEEQTGIKDASDEDKSDKVDEEAKEDAIVRSQMLQGVYNATFNYYNGGAVVVDGFNTSNTFGQSFTEAWASSADADIVANYNAGKADGLKFKQDRENAGKQTGGEVKVDSEFQDAVIQEPVATPTPTPVATPTPAPVVTPAPTAEPTVAPVVEPTPAPTTDPRDQNGNGIFDEFEGAEIVGTPEIVVPASSDVVEEGYTNVAPEGFAPAVEITDEQFNAWLQTEEAKNFVASVAAPVKKI